MSPTRSVRAAPARGSTDPVRSIWAGDANAYFKPYTPKPPQNTIFCGRAASIPLATGGTGRTRRISSGR